MKFTNIRDLRYVTEDNSFIDLFATCEEYGEIPMTLNIVDAEDIHLYDTGEVESHVNENGAEQFRNIIVPLERYCLSQYIAPYGAKEVIIEVPQTITVRQAREQLIKLGLITQVQTSIDSIVDPMQKAIVQNYWEYSIDFKRDNELLIGLASSLGLTSEDLDTMFIEASKL